MRAPLKTTLASWAPSINIIIIIIIIIVIIIIRKKKNMQFDTNEAKLQQQKWDSRPNGTLQLNFPTDQAPFMCPWKKCHPPTLVILGKPTFPFLLGWAITTKRGHTHPSLCHPILMVGHTPS